VWALVDVSSTAALVSAGFALCFYFYKALMHQTHSPRPIRLILTRSDLFNPKLRFRSYPRRTQCRIVTLQLTPLKRKPLTLRRNRPILKDLALHFENSGLGGYLDPEVCRGRAANSDLVGGCQSGETKACQLISCAPGINPIQSAYVRTVRIQ